MGSILALGLTACMETQPESSVPQTAKTTGQISLSYSDDAVALTRSCLDVLSGNPQGPRRLIELGYKNSRSWGDDVYSKRLPYSLGLEFSKELRSISLKANGKGTACDLSYSPSYGNGSVAYNAIEAEVRRAGYSKSAEAPNLWVNGSKEISFTGREIRDSSGTNYALITIRKYNR